MAEITKTALGVVALAGTRDDNYILVASALTQRSTNGTVYLHCQTTDGPVDVTLPEIIEFEGRYSDLKIIVIDTESNATANNITVRANGDDLINSSTEVVIGDNGGAVELAVGSDNLWYVIR